MHQTWQKQRWATKQTAWRCCYPLVLFLEAFLWCCSSDCKMVDVAWQVKSSTLSQTTKSAVFWETVLLTPPQWCFFFFFLHRGPIPNLRSQNTQCCSDITYYILLHAIQYLQMDLTIAGAWSLVWCILTMLNDTRLWPKGHVLPFRLINPTHLTCSNYNIKLSLFFREHIITLHLPISYCTLGPSLKK